MNSAALELFDDAAMSFREIGSAMGITEAEARTLFWSGMAKLRRYFHTRPSTAADIREILRSRRDDYQTPEVRAYLKRLRESVGSELSETTGSEEV